QAEDGIRDYKVTGVQTCALPILLHGILLHGKAGRVTIHKAFVYGPATVAVVEVKRPGYSRRRRGARQRVKLRVRGGVHAVVCHSRKIHDTLEEQVAPACRQNVTAGAGSVLL